MTSRNWHYNAYNSAISDMFTVSNEALVVLLLKHYDDDFNNIINLNRKLTRNESQPRYIKVENRHEMFRGWYRKCINMFNELVTLIMKNRDTV